MDVRISKPPHNPFQYVGQIIKIVLLLTGIVVAFVTFNQFKHSHYFPIKKVRVYGVNHIDPTQIKALLVPLTKSGFFAVNIDHIKEQLSQLPWVAKISVKRGFPDQLEISIKEKNVVARWNQMSLLSESGELFSPDEPYFEKLPHFVGPPGKQIIMLDYFREMNRLFAPLHVNISSLELTPFFTWKLTLNNGITLQIGHKEILTRLHHFVKVYPKIVGDHARDVDYIDLRYPNGVAVRWKQPVKT